MSKPKTQNRRGQKAMTVRTVRGGYEIGGCQGSLLYFQGTPKGNRVDKKQGKVASWERKSVKGGHCRRHLNVVPRRVKKILGVNESDATLRAI